MIFWKATSAKLSWAFPIAKNVFVLPNNSNVILAASQAAELSERNVVVLPTKNVAMGIGAVIAFNPEASVEENREAMTAAAEQVKTGQITFAVRDTVFEDKEIKEGDIIEAFTMEEIPQ